MCLLYQIAKQLCASDSDCPATIFCDEDEGVCVSPEDAQCDSVTDCGTLATCNSDGVCERAVNIGIPYTDANECGK